ncbi:hypothetical protein DRT92_24980 [Salmonella enterica subsp. enterica serovar Newport]|nr:hypothetical protein [Salmonella enterica subsp. enterica serovar Newport]EBS2390923.1 hypothetical protein [Salmonella enterica subsp. enterica serovar Newport]ECA8782494.1 hypothetical protein [Salmonella enterica subsp. enterica serovar Newport]ECD2007378.1 hypothetical protein [Salmonella enterica subsp. enterica serovar Newport]
MPAVYSVNEKYTIQTIRYNKYSAIQSIHTVQLIHTVRTVHTPSLFFYTDPKKGSTGSFVRSRPASARKHRMLCC